MSLVKTLQFHDRYGVKFTLRRLQRDQYGELRYSCRVTDRYNQAYNNEPFAVGPNASPDGGCQLARRCNGVVTQTNTSFYNCPSDLGYRATAPSAARGRFKCR